MGVTLKKSCVPTVSVCILAGGLSSRMGRDKSRIRIGRRTMLGHVRHVAAQLGLPVRVLRRDAVPRCGPLGGIYTALANTRSEAILFLACDMPLVTVLFLKKMLRELRATNSSVFASHKKLFGLPCLIHCDCLPIISRQIANSQFSLQSLARALNAKPLTPSRRAVPQLLNLNTPDDLKSVRNKLRDSTWLSMSRAISNDQ